MNLIQRSIMKFKYGTDFIMLTSIPSMPIEARPIDYDIKRPRLRFGILKEDMDILVELGFISLTHKQKFIMSDHGFDCHLILDHNRVEYNRYGTAFEVYEIGNNIDNNKEIHLCRSFLLKLFFHIPETIYIKELKTIKLW